MPRVCLRRLLLPLAFIVLSFPVPYAQSQPTPSKQPAPQNPQSQPPSSPATTNFAFTAPGLQCSLILVAAPDTDTAFLGTFYGADQTTASGCVSVGGPQVMVVASDGDPGATSSNLLVPSRISEVMNRRLFSFEEGNNQDGGSAIVRAGNFQGSGLPSMIGLNQLSSWRQLANTAAQAFASLINTPAPMLTVPPVLTRRPITGLFEEEEGGPFWSEFEADSGVGASDTEYVSAGKPVQGLGEEGLVRRIMLQGGSSDVRPERGTGPFFTCPQTSSAFWNVSMGVFPDRSSLPTSLVNGSFLLSAGCRDKARSTLFLYNRCKFDIPLTFQITLSSTEYCDLYNFQRYFSNTLFVRVIVMVGGVLACVLVVFSLGCLIGICRNRRAARARARRNQNRLNEQVAVLQGGQNLGRFAPPGAARGRAEVPMYEVTLDAGKEDATSAGAPAEVNVVGRDGRNLIVVIQPGMSANPTLETLAMTGEISIATEERRRSLSRGGSGTAADSALLRGGPSGSQVGEGGPSGSQPGGVSAVNSLSGGGPLGEERLEPQGSGGLPSGGLEMLPLGVHEGR